MSENKSEPPQRDANATRILEGAEGRKGIVVMPVESAPMDIQNLAPGGPPAPQQSTPPSNQSPQSSSSDE
jgi:hypothetical protein